MARDEAPRNERERMRHMVARRPEYAPLNETETLFQSWVDCGRPYIVRIRSVSDVRVGERPPHVRCEIPETRSDVG